MNRLATQKTFLLFACMMIAANLSSAQEEVRWVIGLYEPGTAPKAESAQVYRIPLFSDSIEVPQLKGDSWVESEKKLTELGLTAKKFKDVYQDEDRVIYQKIAAGTSVPKGTEVVLTLTATTPNVVGMTLVEAFDALKSDGFNMKSNPKLPPELKITRQTPSANSTLKRGETISVECLVTVPNVTGMDVAKAKSALNAALLQSDFLSGHQDTDRVLRQKTKAGKMVPAYSKIQLSPGVQIPNLVGKSTALVDATLKQMGVDGKAITSKEVTRFPNMHGVTEIKAQSVPAGGFLPRGRVLEIGLVQHVYVAPQIQGRPNYQPRFGEDNRPNQGSGKMRFLPPNRSNDICPDCKQKNCKCDLGG